MADETREKRTYSRKSSESISEQPAEKMVAQKDVQRLIDEAIAEAMAKVQAQNPQTVIVNNNTEEMVTLLYMGSVAEGSMVYLGKLGEILGRGGTRDIPKKEFFQNLTTPVIERLKDRRLIVLSGLTGEERERYGVKYTEGELLSKDIYFKLLSMKEDDVARIFEKACFSHKEIIVTMYMTAYMKGDNRINQPFIQRLNEISKNDDKEGMFKPILKDMLAAMKEQTE